MRYQTIAGLLTASLFAVGATNLAAAAPNATGSGSAGTTEGRVEGSTNSNSMGEPAMTAKDRAPAKKKKKMRKHTSKSDANASTMPAEPDPTKNGGAKGEAGKTP